MVSIYRSIVTLTARADGRLPIYDGIVARGQLLRPWRRLLRLLCAKLPLLLSSLASFWWAVGGTQSTFLLNTVHIDSGSHLARFRLPVVPRALRDIPEGRNAGAGCSKLRAARRTPRPRSG